MAHAASWVRGVRVVARPVFVLQTARRPPHPWPCRGAALQRQARWQGARGTAAVETADAVDARISTATPDGEGGKAAEILDASQAASAPAGIDKRAYNIAVSSTLMGVGLGVIIPVMPLFAKSLDITPAGLGLVVATMGAARLLCNVPAAWAAERFGRKPLMVGGPLFAGLGTAVCATASALPELVLYRSMSGAGGSFQMTGSQLYLADISRPETRARTMAPLMMGFSLGFALGPVAGGWLAATTGGLAAPFAYVGVAMALAGVNNYLSLSETKVPSPTAVPKTLREEVKVTLQSWKPISANPSMRAVIGVHSVYWGVNSGAIFMLLPLMAAESFGIGVTELGYCFTSLAVVNLIGFKPAAWVSDKYGRKAVTVPACALLFTACMLFPLTTTKESLAAVWLIWSLGATCLGTSPTAYASDLFGGAHRGQALALLRSAGDIGMMCGAGMVGLIAKWGGVAAGFWTSGILIGLVGLNFAYRAVETCGKWKGL
eukprot:TRINITY_DN20274_c0_g1_i1.p1 TRINITY_DN20274_c0_g1~~TRINITY_DN20274_c0_g1_i1.p1  ORF type:complete len:490 (+),score=136.94 TRINITY_DN20274_c0_g1_i1:81-1550(+)